MISLFKGLCKVSTRNFVTIQPSAILKHKKFNTPRDYYNQLLTFADVNEKGLIQIESYHLSRMIEKCNTSDDIDTVFEAYYNLLGHRTFFKNSDVDLLVRKAIECKNTKPIHDLIKHNRVLMYYPNSKVLEELLEHYNKENDTEQAVELGTLLLENPTLKLTSQIMETLMAAASNSTNNDFVLKCYQRCSKHGFETKGQATQKVLINSAYESKKQKDFKEATDYEKSLSKEVNIEQLDADDVLKLAMIQLPDTKAAIDCFSRLLEKKFTKTTDFLIDSQNPLCKEFADKILENVDNNNQFKEQLSQVIKDISAQYGEAAVDPEFKNLVLGETQNLGVEEQQNVSENK